MKIGLIILFFNITCFSNAQNFEWQVLDSIEFEQPIIMFSVDPIGQIYTVQNDGSIFKYHRQNDSIRFFNSIGMGIPSKIEGNVGNTVLLFYKNFGKILLLDNYLSLKLEIDLFAMGHTNISQVCQASDGTLWLYDDLSNNLVKMNQESKITYKSGDFRNLFGEYFFPHYMIEKNSKIYLCDSSNVFVFDRFANFVEKISTTNLKKIIPQSKGMMLIQNNQMSWLDYKQPFISFPLISQGNYNFIDIQCYLNWFFISDSIKIKKIAMNEFFVK